MSQAEAQYTSAGKTFPAVGSKSYQALKDKAVAYLVQRSAIIQQAEKLGVEVTEAEVNSNLKQLITQQFKGSKAKYQAEVKKEKLTEQQVKVSLRDNLIDQRVQAHLELTESATISSKEIKDYYNSHKSAYEVGTSRAVSHILVKTKAQADDIYRQLKAGANFAKLAKKYSTDTGSKSSGGKLGSMEEKKLIKPFAKVLFGSLKTGTFSKPVHTTYGWHIILPTGPIMKAHLQSLSEVTTAIRQSLLTTKLSTEVQAWVKKADKYAADNTNYAASYKPTTTSSSTVSTTTTS
jgi:parvulin-like peptidyl-prolyl isomerase